MCSFLVEFVVTASVQCFCCLSRWSKHLLRLVVRRYLEVWLLLLCDRCSCRSARLFCISAVYDQGSAHEYVVKLLALFGRVVRGFVVVLLFVERVSVGIGPPIRPAR